MGKKKKSKGANVVTIATRQANLKRKFRRHLRSLGFRRSEEDGHLIISGSGKDVIRSLHQAQRNDKLKQSKNFIEDQWPLLRKYFASGSEIDPSNIKPELELIHAGSWQSNLFRLAALTWAVPVSNGFGRRLRYLVWDRYNNKLIGLIAIGDPVFNLTVRDRHIGWDVKARTERLVNILDAYVPVSYTHLRAHET